MQDLNEEARKQVLEHGVDPITCDEYCTLLYLCMRNIGYSERMVELYEYVGDNFIFTCIGHDNLKEITSFEIECIYDYMYDDEVQYEYRLITYIILNSIFHLAIMLGRIDENPCENIDIKE